IGLVGEVWPPRPMKPFELAMMKRFASEPVEKSLILKSFEPWRPARQSAPLVSALVASKYAKRGLVVPVPEVARRMAIPEALFALERMMVAAVSVRTTSSSVPGEAVPMPTLPEAEMSTELVGAPGRMRNGRRGPPGRQNG